VRREFVANVSARASHRARAIKGYAETLRGRAACGPEKAAELVRASHRHTERLRALDRGPFLLLAAVEQGEARMTLAPISLRDVRTSAEAVAAPGPAAKSNPDWTSPRGLPGLRRSRPCWPGLINTARPTRSVHARKGDASEVSAAPLVRQGGGVRQGQRGRHSLRGQSAGLFGASTVSARLPGAGAGTGLGTRDRQAPDQAMGGTIEVESRRGGTSFACSLPVA